MKLALTGLRRALGSWLLIDDQALPPSRRDLIVATRIVLAAGTVAALACVVVPFFLSSTAVDAWGAVTGALALFALYTTLPYWFAPYAIWTKRTAVVDDEILSFYTLTSRRDVDLRRVDRVWTRTFAGKGGVLVTAGLGGEGIPSAWLGWDGYQNKNHPMYIVVRGVTARPGVQVSARARAALDMPDAPGAAKQFGFWLTGACWFLVYCLIGTAAVIAYVNVVSGMPAWTH